MIQEYFFSFTHLPKSYFFSIWNKNNGINTINDFFIKEKIKGKIGTFEFRDNKVSQQLKMYKTDGNKFKEF